MDSTTTTSTLPADVSRLLEDARELLSKAYAPYSHFFVAAVLVGKSGTRYHGCNVECASYGGTICAERNALCSAIAQGEREFSHLLVYTAADKPTPPCGLCRQMLVEFAPDLQVFAVTTNNTWKSWILRDLLPEAFGPDQLS